MKIIGAVLVVLSCSVFGMNMARTLRTRAEFLHSLVHGLTILRNELCVSLLTVGEVLEMLAEGSCGSACEFFSQCLRNFGNAPFKTSWVTAALGGGVWGLNDEECRMLAGLGDVIGRYEAEKQRELIERVSRYFSERAQLADEEKRRQYKLRAALGIGSGLMLAVLLL